MTSGDNTALVQSAIVKITERLGACKNGDRPAVRRELGDLLATLDHAAWIDTKPELLASTDLKASDAEKLRRDGLGRQEQRRRKSEERSKSERSTSQAPDGGEAKEAAYFSKRGVAGTPLLYWRKPTTDGTVPVLLAHFVPTITAESLRHKASGETLRIFTVELDLPRGVRTMELVSEQVADDRAFYTACVNCAGGDLLLATIAAKKHLAEAAKTLASPDREQSELYEFTGWHERDGRLVYLAAAGAIGTEKPLAVDLSGLALGTGVPALANFGPRDDGDDSLREALDALAGPVRGCFPDLVTLPGLAAVFLAPLLHFSPTIDRPGLHFIGTTGVRKSAWLAIMQAFYGLTEPALSWRGTANSIEIALSSLRDALVTVDDLKTGTSDRGAAVKILQSYADRRGRSRATRTGELAQARFVGGLLVSAGEDVPSGEASVAARSLFVPVGADDSRLDRLTQAQEAAPQLATLTARYIGWVIDHQDDIGESMRETFIEARARFRQILANRKGMNDAGRVAVNCALLETGMVIGCQWLQAVGWSERTAQEWLESTQEALATLAYSQAEAIGEESAALGFLRALRALLDSRRAELATVEDGHKLPDLAGCAPSAPGAVMIGWRTKDGLLLQPEVTMREIRLWSGQGMRGEVSKRGLYAQLRDGGWLAKVDPGGKTEVVYKIGGRAQRVLVLRTDALSENGDPEDLAQF